uniref:Uncharacterized protein n=1 Tax=Physcomitrium patens TaxID=3218 RepID=A0A2K1KCX1_PHYPA|nr:hypothetical protein PHYPA_010814 [Physcomitrium patens]
MTSINAKWVQFDAGRYAFRSVPLVAACEQNSGCPPRNTQLQLLLPVREDNLERENDILDCTTDMCFSMASDKSGWIVFRGTLCLIRARSSSGGCWLWISKESESGRKAVGKLIFLFGPLGAPIVSVQILYLKPC